MYNRIKLSLSFELVLIEGDSGIEKSDLTLELHKPITKEGIIIYGKFDYLKSEPYSTMIEAVKIFCDVLALEDEITLAKILLSYTRCYRRWW